jgi:hypothetical protein
MTETKSKQIFPVLLTKAEAMNFAADRLEEMVASMELAKIMLDIFGKRKIGGDSDEKIAQLRRELPEPELQIRVLTEAARTIRDAALEERLVAARAADRGMELEKRK